MPAPQRYLEPTEEKFTRWHNPLSVRQNVVISHDGDSRPTQYTIKPGETREIPSRYDLAIHRVHNGVVIGGLAPQLVKVGAEEKLDPVLDTTLQDKKQAEAERAVAAAAKQAAEDALILAEHRKREAEAAKAEIEKAKAEAAKAFEPASPFDEPKVLAEPPKAEAPAPTPSKAPPPARGR